VERAGFFEDGKFPHSVTRTVSKDIDKANITKRLATSKKIPSSTTNSTISTEAEVVVPKYCQIQCSFLHFTSKQDGLFHISIFYRCHGSVFWTFTPITRSVTDHFIGMT
jgi:hypothetical protein